MNENINRKNLKISFKEKTKLKRHDDQDQRSVIRKAGFLKIFTKVNHGSQVVHW